MSELPAEAKHIITLDNRVAIYDVSHLLPKRGTGYESRDIHDIDVCFFHHSGADGKAGYAGIEASTRYVVSRRKFPGCPYTFWLPATPVRDVRGYTVVFQCNPIEARSWHTGKDANRRGISICFQGNLTKKPPTENQYVLASALVGALHGYNKDLHWVTHSEADVWGGSKKAACPGPFVEAFVKGLRSL